MSIPDRPVVATTAGTVAGLRQTESSAAFLGIPFAEPPIGDLRFAAPVPRTPWPGTFEATVYGATPQRRQLMAVTAIPEPSIPGDDTLLLNVFTPKPGDAEAKLPVYVWIHGGGYTAGSPASPWYNGRAFNRDGIVTVTVSYRLGFIGFGHLDDAPDNRGVLDWLLALEWVRDNIAQFGGNPDDVTIGGQSAGGGAVLTLLACERAQPLFHKVISHSGAPADISLAAAKGITAKIAEACGVEPTVAAMRELDENAILDAQDALSAAAMKSAPTEMLSGMIRRESGMLTLGPVVDGDLYGGLTAERLAAAADKPLLIGSTANEFNMITQQAPKVANLVPATTMLHKGGLPKDVAKAYVAARSGKSMEVLGQFLTDLMFHVPLVEICAAHPQSWAFEFRWPSPLSGSAPHCLDLPFAWDCLDAEQVDANTGPNPPQSLADAMHGAWVRFIQTGDPGWSRYQAPTYAAMVFDDPSSEGEDVFAPERALSAAVTPIVGSATAATAAPI